MVLDCVVMAAVLGLSPADAAEAKGPIKVFILAGQSNMEGRGFPEPLTWQVSQEKYRKRWTHFIKDGDYAAFAKKVAETTDPNDKRKTPTYLWSTRSDVWINYLDKHGDLTVGYGAPREGFGPEYNFGHVTGNHYDEQVLLIKASWGGRALARGFLPPSSMLDDAEYAKQAAEQNAVNKAWNEAEPAKIEAYNKKVTEDNKTATKKKGLRKFKPRPIVTPEEYKDQFGKDYRNMVAEVHGCLADLKNRFPGYKDQEYEILGFAWFQGWNDQYQDRWLTYEKNMANFIRDVRKEFKAPEMKFVIGQMGHDGMKPDKEDSPRDYIKKAQAAVPEMPEFKGNALCVKTDKFWDMEAHAIYTGPGGWAKDINKWRQFGNDRGYHYYGSPWTFAQIGTAFGESMLELLK
jgi:alpha-galactosidase